jgi:hypothetical protein
MVRYARILDDLKRYLKRFKPTRSQPVVKTLTEELKSEKCAPQRDLPHGQTARTGSLKADGVDQTDWHPGVYPPGYRYRVSTREKRTVLEDSPEIDLTSLDDLDARADGMTVPAETIESWVAAGILSPRETEVAERLVRLMRAKHRPKSGSE